MFDAGPLIADARGARLAVRVTPRANNDQVDGVERGADERLWVIARVRAVPDRGKANAAIGKLMADEIGVAKSYVSVLSGGTSRNKILLIEGEPGELMPQISAWLEGIT